MMFGTLSLMSSTMINREANALFGGSPPSSAIKFRWYNGTVSQSKDPVVLITAEDPSIVNLVW